MCDRMLDSVCRLCLTENFTHISIFTKRFPSGEFVYDVLNLIYGLKIFEGDGLPSKICVPCLWRMLEFHTYKKNVNYANLEIKKLLEKIRSNSHEVSREQAIDNDVLEEEELPMNDASDVGDARDNVNETEASTKKEIDIEEWTMPEEIQPEKDNLEVSVKDEIDVVEWEIPNDLQSKVDIEEEHCSGRQFSLEEVRNSFQNDMESTEVVIQAFMSSRMDLEEKEGFLRNEKVEQMKISLGVEAEQKEEESIERNKEAYESISSQTCVAVTSECVRDRNESAEIIENGSSVVSNSENNDKIEEVMQNDVSNDGNEEEESLNALMLESSDNLSKSSASRSVTAVKRKQQDFVCDICKKSFVFKIHLSRHVRVHYIDRPFKCNKCGKAFKQDGVRRAHELLHLKKEDDNASKPFSCDICAKQFKYKSGLSGHSNVHKNKYMCWICGKSFGCNYHLNEHLKIHTNEKPFTCNFCKMSFSYKGNLNRHLAIHSDDRPFKCNVCHKRFKFQSNKSHHELLHFRSN